jgi:nucleoside-diphosphate-sugar epimerase
MSRLLVTGSSGFIGRSTVVALRKLGHEVYTLDNHGDTKGIFPVDIIDTDLENIFDEIKPQAVIQLAAR